MENIIHWNDKDLVVSDFKKSHVNGGRLGKFWVQDIKTGREFLIKGSTLFSYEPFSEKIAYIVGKNLGMDILEYDILPAELFKGIIPIKSYCKYISICEKIDKKGYSIMSVAEIKRARNIILNEGEKPITNREVMYDLLPKKYIDTMFLFDAIIGNNDRHYGNVHLLRSKDGEIIGAPILDNGASCLANTNILTLIASGYNIGKIVDASKTIEAKHIKQIQYADSLNGISFDISLKTLKILEEIQPTLDLMPKYRANAIKKYLVYRLHKYLGMIKNNELHNDATEYNELINKINKEKEHT